MSKTKRYILLIGILLVAGAFIAGYYFRGRVSPNVTENQSESVEESKIVEKSTSEEKLDGEKTTLPVRKVLEGVDLLEVRYSKKKYFGSKAGDTRFFRHEEVNGRWQDQQHLCDEGQCTNQKT